MGQFANVYARQEYAYQSFLDQCADDESWVDRRALELQAKGESCYPCSQDVYEDAVGYSEEQHKIKAMLQLLDAGEYEAAGVVMYSFLAGYAKVKAKEEATKELDLLKRGINTYD